MRINNCSLSNSPPIQTAESDSDDKDDKPKPKVVKKTVESKTVKQDVVSDGKLKKKTVFPTAAKIEVVKPKLQEKPVRKPVKYAEIWMHRLKGGKSAAKKKKNPEKSAVKAELDQEDEVFGRILSAKKMKV
ncbi:hypothetical protein Tco_0974347 [Tanacetum coccineum]|uniref:Uncharacterized protein n=1 Tax=Tanacetum coccineum TaxID=301880 RepID=A0ABQ5EBB2_9ASTR